MAVDGHSKGRQHIPHTGLGWAHERGGVESRGIHDGVRLGDESESGMVDAARMRRRRGDG